MEIEATLDEEIGWITLNRPQLRNAISREMWDNIPRALQSLKDAGARVVIFRGEGDAFASGADLAELSSLDSKEKAKEHWMSIRDALNAVAAFELPTIAMIVGPCMGGGCLLAVACDMRFCDTTARFSVPVAQLGIFLDEDNIVRLVDLVGRGVAAELLFSGNVISASRAREVGLVNAMLPVVQLDGVVTGMAEDIKRSVDSSVIQIKRALATICQRGRVEEDQGSIIASYLSDDFRARVARALSKAT